jgi:hypothetical protein
MREVLLDRELVYGNLIRDIYNAGVVLERKYRLLRIAYIAFVVTVVVSFNLYIIFFVTSA